MEAVVQLIGQLVASEAQRCEQIGSADVADEEGVTGEHAVGHLVVRVFPDHDADRLGGVAGGVADLELHIAQRDAFAVGELA